MNIEKSNSEAFNARNQLFSERKIKLEQNFQTFNKRNNRYSNLRLVAFLAFLAFLIAYFSLGQPWWMILLSGASVVIFVYLVVVHNRCKQQQESLLLLMEIHAEYQGRTEHDFSLLKDTGEDFVDLDHPFSGDLDLFGESSLFHLMSVASTFFGRKTFAQYLLWGQKEDKNLTEIKQRQGAVAELKNNIELLQNFQVAGRKAKQSSKDPSGLLSYLSSKDQERPLVGLRDCFLAIGLTLLFWAATAISLFTTLIPSYVPLLFLVLQIVYTALNYSKYKPVFASIDDFQDPLQSYTGLFREVENAEVKSLLLQETKKILAGNKEDASASQRIGSFKKICLAVQARSQPLLFFILNLLCLYDTYCIFFLERWKRDSGNRLEDYMKALGVWEGLMSLTTLSFVYPESHFPSFTAPEGHNPSFEGELIGHPLLPLNRQIRNSFSLNKGTALITGSNMSGKTTFLRTVGINCVLAYAGSICCGNQITLSLMQLATSMRIADNLSEGLSTFYAELLRIEKIISLGKEQKPMLFLIDEIFRGTNSRDRTEGATSVLRNLNRPWIIGMMSTHDYELCGLSSEDGVGIENFHFSEHYDQEGIHFDYRLEKGVSLSSNARYLMRLVGIE